MTPDCDSTIDAATHGTTAVKRIDPPWRHRIRFPAEDPPARRPGTPEEPETVFDTADDEELEAAIRYARQLQRDREARCGRA